MEANDVIAPFVLKTYQMVNDPTTDMLITWGKANNSLIVIDPLDFSHRMLPLYFKHNNFSSFVRQLNTYGFRKVDPDRWEFAHEYFLRGEKQLLQNIVRRKHAKNPYTQVKSGDLDDEGIVMEIAKLKEEQKALEEELQGLSKRLEETERRPQQMMAFLYKVVEDPDLLPRMMLEKQRTKRLNTEKKRRLMMSLSSSSSSRKAVSSSIKSEEEEEEATLGVISSSSPETEFNVDNFCQSSASPDNSMGRWLGQRQMQHMNYGSGLPTVLSPCDVIGNSVPVSSSPSTSLLLAGNNSGISGYGDRNGQMSYFGEVIGGVESSSPPPYPFSLLGGGF